jgi:hypothetical protein
MTIENSSYVVVADHPYYPKVKYCETREEAEEKKESFEDSLFVEDGEHECIVMILEPASTSVGSSHY